MPAVSLQLPLLQNWSCHNCGGCCRQHAISITEEERDRILAQNWTPESGIPAGQELIREERSWLGKPHLQLAHQPDGACVFLNEQGLCRIHAKYGEPAKPLACRIYPYAFHPSGKELTVSLRFSCPSVADNLGRPVAQQKKDLKELAAQVLPANYRGAEPPKLTNRIRLNWPDTQRVTAALDESFCDSTTPVALQLLRILFWLDLVGQAKFDIITGERLDELLGLLREASVAEVPEIPAERLPPSSISLSQFRLLAGQYARKDTEGTIDLSWRGRWRQMRYAMQLASGKETLPPLQPGLKPLPFTALDADFGPLPPESTEMLRRYYRVKIQGLHFCGAGYYHIPVIEGFQSLALVFPVVLWLARWLAASDSRTTWTHADLREALTLVDHQHGYSPILGMWGARRRVKNLVATGDLQKLIGRFA
ncbi:YkgJ family cysteine cluster protein [Planctomicrobium piriforme]|uniref:Lysine-N-methylase n=1 Tax=Planctomicrobium piriforme TaxID=1576369 RepID=A0A1I3JHT2_9PLAN|nr:YkgJ family cysteine cluster protein [Planctomicrobium piriforme]SFI59734.1 lysine-N-methylase [Planctomicrobium piriforme]